MAELTPLERISSTLQMRAFPCEILDADAATDQPVEVLLVSLGEDPEEPVILEICYPSDLFENLGWTQGAEDPVIVQFLVRYRFSYDDEIVNELALFLNAMNRVVPLGAFGFTQEVGTIHFRYVLYQPGLEVPDIVLIDIVSAINTFVADMAPAIVAVASGMATAQEAQAQLANDGIMVTPILPGPASLIEPA